MRNRLPLIALALAGAMAVTLPPAQAADSTVAVRFAAGGDAASFNGRVRGRDKVDYRIAAEAGQTMTIRFRPGTPGVFFDLIPPGGGRPIHDGAMAGETFTGTLQASGTYVARVYLARGAARRGAMARYTITFEIDGHGARNAAPPAGPGRRDTTEDRRRDLSTVSGLSRGDTLTVRTAPSYSARVVLRLDEGATVRNCGCEERGGARWCRVGAVDSDQPAGWSAARYLTEAAPPAREARVPGTPFQATGQLECRIQGQAPVTCPFGVRRHGPQTATVEITRPGGERRILVFRSGQVSTEGREPVVATRERDAMAVTIDGRERYVIPDAVIQGD